MTKPTTLPAVTTVRGFHTPVASGDEDSDYSLPSTPRYSFVHTKLNDVVSANCSPIIRPSSGTGIGGISKLKLQLDAINFDNESRSNSFLHGRSHLGSRPQSSTGTATTEGSDDEMSDGTSYEIPLEHDFISSEVRDPDKPLYGAVEGGLVHDNVARKMTATDFEPLRCLGRGAFGTVLLVKQQTTGKLFAQKQLKKASLVVHKKWIEQTRNERAILESVSHPFVVKLYYAFQDHEKLYLILEYAPGGELFRLLAQERLFPEETASFYMAEMLLALDHLHTNLGVVYRDLKPENCLLDADGHLLLTDFGLSKVAVDDADQCKSSVGTPQYMAPEVILGNKYSFAVDWWSFGALGYDLLTGGPPFQANNNAKIMDKIVKSKLTMPYFLGPDAKDLLARLLRKEPNKRLGSNMPKDLAIMKKHRFFRKINWAKLTKREMEPPIQPLVTDPELAENFADEFTDAALSPVISKFGRDPWDSAASVNGDNPFGGFSYVASNSLLEKDGWPKTEYID